MMLFWPCHAACGILVTWPGIKSRPLAVDVQSPNHWTAREFPNFYTIFKGYFPFTVITKYWLYSPCCTMHPWAYLTPNSLYLSLPPHIALPHQLSIFFSASSTCLSLPVPHYHVNMFKLLLKTKWDRDFPGGPVVKNPPSNAGDAGSIPGIGTKIPHEVGQLNPRAATTEPVCSGACTLQRRPRAAGLPLHIFTFPAKLLDKFSMPEVSVFPLQSGFAPIA